MAPAYGLTLLGINDSSQGELYEISISGHSLQMNLIRQLDVPLATLEYNPYDGLYYGYTRTHRSWPKLYSLDPGDGYALTLLGDLTQESVSPFVFEGAMAFSPDGEAYGINLDVQSSNGLFKLDLANRSIHKIATLDNGSHDINGVAWWDGWLVGIDQVQEAVVKIDVTTGATTSLFSLQSLRENGVSVLGGIGGMTLVGDVAYFSTASTTASPKGSNQLYRIDLRTGQLDAIGTLTATAASKGIGAVAVPEPATLVFLGAVSFMFRPRRRH